MSVKSGIIRPTAVNARAVLSAAAMACLVFSGCSRGKVRLDYQGRDFSLEDLRLSHSLLVVSHDVRVFAFAQAFETLYGSSESLAANLSEVILDSLHKTPAVSVRPAPGIRLRHLLAPDTLGPGARKAVDSLLLSLGARYVTHIRRITISNSRRDPPRTALPQGGVSAGAGATGRECVVTVEVDVLSPPGAARRLGFTVRAHAEVLSQAYQTALEEAVGAAARLTAAHIRGY